MITVMKKILSIALSLILILGASSCKDWLDVNTNPNSPNSESATIELRLPWVQYYYAYSWAVASVRSNATTQIITTTNNNLGQFDGNNHISKLANKRVEKVEDVVNIGDEVEVEVLKVDDKGRIDFKLVCKK